MKSNPPTWVAATKRRVAEAGRAEPVRVHAFCHVRRDAAGARRRVVGLVIALLLAGGILLGWVTPVLVS